MVQQTLAIDFGTSNSAAAVLEKGRVRRLSIEADADTLPTAAFFAPKGGEMLIGEAASAALIGGEEGRYMRALKSVLGTSLFHEPPSVHDQVSQPLNLDHKRILARCRWKTAVSKSSTEPATR